RCVELMKRTDDSDHGAEQTDEGRIVPEGAEERQAAFEEELLQLAFAGHAFFGLFGSAGSHACSQDASFARRGLVESLQSLFGLAASQKHPQITAKLS